MDERGISSPNDEAAVREVLLNSATSFEKNDIAGATKVWANDESLTVFESGHANYGWTDYRDNHLVPEMGEMKNTKYGFSDIKIHVAGNTAWATFKYTMQRRASQSGGLIMISRRSFVSSLGYLGATATLSSPYACCA